MWLMKLDMTGLSKSSLIYGRQQVTWRRQLLQYIAWCASSALILDGNSHDSVLLVISPTTIDAGPWAFPSMRDHTQTYDAERSSGRPHI